MSAVSVPRRQLEGHAFRHFDSLMSPQFPPDPADSSRFHEEAGSMDPAPHDDRGYRHVSRHVRRFSSLEATSMIGGGGSGDGSGDVSRRARRSRQMSADFAAASGGHFGAKGGGLCGELYGEQSVLPVERSVPAATAVRVPQSASPEPKIPTSLVSPSLKSPLPKSPLPHQSRSPQRQPRRFHSSDAIPLQRGSAEKIPQHPEKASPGSLGKSSVNQHRPRRVYSSDAIPLTRGAAGGLPATSPRSNTPPRSPLSRSPLPRSPLALASPPTVRGFPVAGGNSGSAEKLHSNNLENGFGSTSRSESSSRRLKRDQPVSRDGATSAELIMAAKVTAAAPAPAPDVPLDLLASARQLMAECEARGVRWELLNAAGLGENSAKNDRAAKRRDAALAKIAACNILPPTADTDREEVSKKEKRERRFGRLHQLLKQTGEEASSSNCNGGISSRHRRLLSVDQEAIGREKKEKANSADAVTNGVFRNASGVTGCYAGDLRSLHEFDDVPNQLLQKTLLSSAGTSTTAVQTESESTSNENIAATSSAASPIAVPVAPSAKSALPLVRLRHGRVSSCSSLPISSALVSAFPASPLSPSPLSPSPLSPSPLSPLSAASPSSRVLPASAAPSPAQQQLQQNSHLKQSRVLGKHGSLEQLSGFFSGVLSLSRGSSGSGCTNSGSSSPCPGSPGSFVENSPAGSAVKDAPVGFFHRTAREALLQSGQGRKALKPADFLLRMPYEDIKGRYSLGKKEIGDGRFGSIRTCLERSTGSFYACKTISKKIIQSNEEAEDVRREVTFLAMLKGHPHIVTLKEALEDKKAIHLIMELCPGGDLFERIKSRDQLSEPEAALILRQLLEALIYTHSMGILHRDVKPENILLTSPSSCTPIKLIDFGVATVLAAGTQCTEMAGTPEYMAPEVYDEEYGTGADVWGAGVSLYVMLSGIPPFWESTNRSLEHAIRSKKVSFKHWKWAGVSVETKELITRMLEKDPRKRITAQEALEHPWIAKMAPATA
ncbi:hypothetical protein CLOM_g17752 [Closterium sp. NIES-68]|nr:hypothetical protein CLOM_g17752 [Closterium sp. NIES-68]GJP62046.1 hypothetical protein CLOP_g19150 [Closterium sp. NIES-67]